MLFFILEKFSGPLAPPGDGLVLMYTIYVYFFKFRAEFAMCDSEEDFGAKLYGIRLAFRIVMNDEHTVQWLIQSGLSFIAGLLRSIIGTQKKKTTK